MNRTVLAMLAVGNGKHDDNGRQQQPQRLGAMLYRFFLRQDQAEAPSGCSPSFNLDAGGNRLDFLPGMIHAGAGHEPGAPAVYERSVLDPERPFSDRLAITQTGREVLEGVTDWLSLQPPLRWLGGVRINPSTPNWRWDEARQDVTMA